MTSVGQGKMIISCCCLKEQEKIMRKCGWHSHRWLGVIQLSKTSEVHTEGSGTTCTWGYYHGYRCCGQARRCEESAQSERGEHVVHVVETEKAKTRWILLWIFHLTCAPFLPVSKWNRQWRVRHASATAIGRLMRWHQAREWLIGLMRITVSKCFFIPLWLAMRQICYLYSRLWWITETHGLGVRRVQS